MGKDTLKLQPRFDYPALPFNFTGSITLTNSSLVAEACIFAEQAEYTFRESVGEFGQFLKSMPSGERYLVHDDINNYNPVNLISFSLLIEACVFYDNIIAVGGNDPYDILSHSLLYNRKFKLSQFLIDNGVLLLTGDYNYQQLNNSNIPRVIDKEAQFPTQSTPNDKYKTARHSWILLSGDNNKNTKNKIHASTVEDEEWRIYGVFMFLVIMSRYAVPITINPKWLPYIHYLSGIRVTAEKSLIQPFISELSKVINNRANVANSFSEYFGGVSKVAMPPVASIILGRVGKGEELGSAIMNVRKQFASLRRLFAERQQILSEAESSILDLEAVQKGLFSDIARIREEFSADKNQASWAVQEWRAIPGAIKDVAKIAESVTKPAQLTELLAEKIKSNIDAIEQWYKFRHLRQAINLGKEFLTSNSIIQGLNRLTGVSLEKEFVSNFNKAIMLLQNEQVYSLGAFIDLVGKNRCDALICFERDKLNDNDLIFLKSLNATGWN